MVAWSCGHRTELELSWLPDRRVRRRRAVETLRHGWCLACGPGGAAPAAGGAAARAGEVGPGCRAVVGGGPVVTSWGVVRVVDGGRVAAASGSVTELDGGAAAVSDGGLLVARRGVAVIDAGGRVRLAEGARDLEVRVLPWGRVQVGALLRLVTQPAGVVLRADGTLVPPAGGLGGGLGGLLEASRAAGPRP